MLRFYARALLTWSALAVALLLGGFVLLADEVLEGETQRFDDSVLAYLAQPGEPGRPIGPAWLVEGARDVTALGSFVVLGALVVVVCLYLLLARRVRTARFLFVSAVAGSICSTLLKHVFDRPRPSLQESVQVFTASFPSGHALLSAVCYLTIGALLAEQTEDVRLRRYFIVAAAVITLFVGLSRIYLGVHFPTDVLAGWLIGTGWAMATFVIARVRRQQRGER